MRLRLAALLALASAALYYSITEPARARLSRVAEEQRALQTERRALMQRLLPLERAAAARARALAALAATPLPEGREAQALRRTVLATLAGESLRGVRVSVQPQRGREVAAAIGLACEGGLDSVLRTVTRLTQPGSGLVLSRTRLAVAPSGVALDLEARGMRPRS